jgi:hypothetical protein
MRVFVLAGLLLIGCNPGKQLSKAEARLAQAGRLPAICSERYPVKDTTYIKDTLVKIDTFLSGEYIFDTARINDTLYEVKYKPVVVYKTKYITKVEMVEDVAKIEALRTSVSQLEANRAVLSAQLAEYKDKARTRLNWLILALCVVFGFAIRKPVMALINYHLSKW